MQPNQAPNETKLPRAVIRRSAAIAARYAQPAESEPPVADANAAPASTPAAAPAPPADTPAPAPAGDPRESDPAYWKQRFQVTQGILSRERTERHSEREGLHQQVADLNTQLRSAQAAPKPAQTIDVSQFFSPEEVEKYGQEQCEAMARVALKASGKSVEDQIAAAVQPLKDRQTRSDADALAHAKNVFTEQLIELYPNFLKADVDPRWLAWLADDDENGVQRQEILDIHIGKRDARACARMFKAWEKTLAPVAATPPPPAPPITPSGSGAAPGSDTPEAPQNAEAAAAGYPGKTEIKEFYKNAALGKVKPDERVKFEARLALRNAAR